MSSERSTFETVDPLRVYLDEIGRYNLLTREQEVALAVKIREGVSVLTSTEQFKDAQWLPPTGNAADMAVLELLPLSDEQRVTVAEAYEAKQQFYHANLRLVVSIAKKYARPDSHMKMLDVIQEGNIGLNRAVDKFDYKKGFKFSTYATWWIRQAITRGMSDQENEIRLPVHAVETVRRLQKVRERLATEKDGVRPSEEELAHALGVDSEKLAEWEDIELLMVTRSLDEPRGDEEDATLLNYVSTPKEDDGEFTDELTGEFTKVFGNSELLETLISVLSFNERLIIEERFGLAGEQGKTLEVIGQELHVTRERIRQIEKKALLKMKRRAVDLGLMDDFIENSSKKRPRVRTARTLGPRAASDLREPGPPAGGYTLAEFNEAQRQHRIRRGL